MKSIRLKKHSFLIDLEKLNTLNEKGCPACGRKFTLGEIAVMATGPWEGGARVIHENEAVWDARAGRFIERTYFLSRTS